MERERGIVRGEGKREGRWKEEEVERAWREKQET